MTRPKPNIILIITDQERSHKHWPPGWAEQNLPTHYDRLIGCRGGGRHRRSSVTFPNAFTATTECSPSRASLLTSSYPTEHGVKTTPGALDPRSDLGLDVVAEDAAADGSLDGKKERPNLLRLLSTEGYNVAWKGKWHLSPPLPSSVKQSSMLKWYGATSPWNPPDAGHSLNHSYTLGGGKKYNHDGRFLRGTKRRFESPANTGVSGASDEAGTSVSSDDDSDSTSAESEEEECIFDFIAKQALSGAENGKSQANHQQEDPPFFLIASLVNPHDVWASSCFSHLTDDEFYKETGYHPRDFDSLPIDLPPNHKDDLDTKPVIQSLLRGHPVFGDLPDAPRDGEKSDALRYVRFYAHLHKLVDAEIGSLLDALEATGKLDNTIIVRMADHGELALSHGLREKRMQCYEETMGIPLVINYPSGWFDQSREGSNAAPGYQTFGTRSLPHLVSSVDILPTIAELAGVDCSKYLYRGKTLLPFLRNDGLEPSMSEIQQKDVLFTFDEPLAPPGIPGYVRCLRTCSHKYAVYFTGDGDVIEYEMYDLKADPLEMKNLVGPDVEPDERWMDFHDRLTELMKKMGAVPVEFDWEKMTEPRCYSWS